jgi:peroxiredoxin
VGRNRAFAGILAATVLVTASSSAFASGRDLTGRPAPEINVQQGLCGLPSGCTLQSLRGHVVVLKFWFPGCGACRRQLPGFQSLCDQYRSRGVQFIAVAFADADEVVSFVRQNGYTFPVAVDPDGVTSSRYGVVSYPTTYVIGADGVVKSYDELSAGVIERELRATPIATPAVLPARRSENVAVVRDADRNVAELGEVPDALAAVRPAVARNDYGEVARVVRDHFDVSRDGRTVVEAAGRIENLARRRWTNRAEAIRARWNDGDTRGAWEEMRVLAADFRATKFGDATVDWSERFERPDATYVAIHRTWTVVSAPATASTAQPASATVPDRSGTRATASH